MKFSNLELNSKPMSVTDWSIFLDEQKDESRLMSKTDALIRDRYLTVQDVNVGALVFLIQAECSYLQWIDTNLFNAPFGASNFQKILKERRIIRKRIESDVHLFDITYELLKSSSNNMDSMRLMRQLVYNSYLKVVDYPFDLDNQNFKEDK